MSSTAKHGTPWQFKLLHGALAAATIASAMLLAEAVEWLDWLDAVMLRMVAPLESASSSKLTLPTVVTIDSKAYASDFQMRSPLPRKPVEDLLQRIVKSQPALLLVDLQMEPAVDELPARSIDKALLAAAKKDEHGKRLQIVLPIPEMRTQELDAASLTWMREMCRGGVHFARATIRSHFGTVVRYDLDPATLAMTGLASLKPTNKPSPAAECAAVSTGCQLACRAGALQDVHRLIEGGQQIVSNKHTQPIPPSLLRQLEKQSITSRDPQLTSWLAKRNWPHTVVLGGTYDSRDRVTTHAGEFSGVFVHAASIGGHEMVKENHVIAWCADVLVGAWLGLAFMRAWECSAALKRRLRRTLAPNAWRRGLVFYAGLMSQLLIWSLPLALTIGMLLISGWLIERGFWLNPGPIIIGTFLHAMLTQHDEHHAVTTLHKFLHAHPAALLAQLPFVLFAWAVYLWLH